ncbi:hypothetical protein JJL45_09220 [Tamlana sp. s12]|uniref:hypothetical protein n=1 Tax=Tamlana sp. s12 TaxID=1630406 RepID=UPI0007FBEE74|nr:hypothetical protein [Tamlana sp. s12]OBQ52864.1 hypothetical protein VQ01_13025 [Tamlana sp. s12]QQY81110.1 hypothetical protein JJL45_09220 [Tamlana sp. s12]
MTFIKLDPETGNIKAVTGTTRGELKKFYKCEKNFAKLSAEFNSIAPEIKGLTIFPAKVVRKIIEELGMPSEEIDMQVA